MTSGLNLTGSFFPSYKTANPGFSSDTFHCAEETVAELLQKATSSDHPGMLLGKVQSGKTRTFISILALAFDNVLTQEGKAGEKKDSLASRMGCC